MSGKWNLLITNPCYSLLLVVKGYDRETTGGRAMSETRNNDDRKEVLCNASWCMGLSSCFSINAYSLYLSNQWNMCLHLSCFLCQAKSSSIDHIQVCECHRVFLGLDYWVYLLLDLENIVPVCSLAFLLFQTCICLCRIYSSSCCSVLLFG